MRPLLLEIEGLRSFRTKTIIDFTNIGLFAIVGDTGSGKSSILEAITYALYNASTWSKSNPKELLCSDSEQMCVAFQFELSDKRYSVTRRTARSGYPPPTHLLEGPDLRADGEAEVKTQIERLVGLEYATFIKTMVLPQGKFSDLLTATPGDRTKILREILALDQLKGLKDLLDPYRARARETVSNLQAKREALPSDPNGELEATQRQGVEAECRVAELTAARKEIAKYRVAIDSAKSTQQEANRLFGTLNRFDPCIAGLKELVRVDADLSQKLKEAHTRVDEARKVADKADADLTKLVREHGDRSVISTHRAALERFLFDRGRWRKATEDLQRDRAQHSRESNALLKAKKALSKLQSAARKALQSQADAHGQLEQVNAKVVEAQSAIKAFKDLTKALSEANIAAKSASDAQERADINLSAETKDLAVAGTRMEQAAAALAEVKRTNVAAELSHGLHAGDDCPICKRKLPATFVPAKSTKLQSAEKAYEAASRSLDSQRAKVTEAHGDLQSAKATLKSAAVAVAGVKRDLERCKNELQALGVTEPSERAALGGVQAAAAAAKEVFEAAQEQAVQANDALSRESSRLSTQEGGLGDLAQALEARGRDLQSDLDRLSAALESLPPRYRPAFEADPNDVRRLQAALQKAEDAAQQIERLRDGSRHLLGDLLNAVNVLTTDYKNCVELPLQSAISTLKRQREALAGIAEF